jgi:hypothetical protein
MREQLQRLYSLGYSDDRLANSQFQYVLLGLSQKSRFGICLVILLKGTTRH